jgi:acetyl/propionyl-CoA carboxylase alpha subunit
VKATRLLVANRGEVAIRIIKAATEVGLQSVAVFSEDDVDSLHARMADQALPLSGVGAEAYLDIEQIIAIARGVDASLIHPGYGLLSENAQFADRCSYAGITFVGPSSEVLSQFGNKSTARGLASRLGIPVLQATEAPTTIEDARHFLGSLPEGQTCMVKSAFGGGGRGIRQVNSLDQLEAAFKRCQSEAESAFGDGALYLEQSLDRARHIEIQVVGDRQGALTALSDRDCSIQRHRQKLIEIAPAPDLPESLRTQLADAALLIAETIGLESLCTFEFLVDLDRRSGAGFVFLEANPRLQVEHTVTEQALGVDLVTSQLQIAQGATLSDLQMEIAPRPRGHAIQARVNLETMRADGTTVPASGSLTAFEPPTGPGIRVDTDGHTGYRLNPNFDSLLAKVIVHSLTPGISAAADKARRALDDFRLEGVDTNIALLQNILSHQRLFDGQISTRFVDEHASELAGSALSYARLHASGDQKAGPETGEQTSQAVSVTAPTDGRVVEVCVASGAQVQADTALLVVEAMKMEHVVATPQVATVAEIAVSVGGSAACAGTHPRRTSRRRPRHRPSRPNIYPTRPGRGMRAPQAHTRRGPSRCRWQAPRTWRA